MSFGIKVKDSFACDSYQGVAWFCDEERALRYPTEECAEKAAKYIAKEYNYKIVPLAINVEEAKKEIERLEGIIKESIVIMTQTTWNGFRYHEYLKKTEQYK